MRQGILTGPRRTLIDEVEPLSAGPGEVVVRVLACGVCASELEPWQDGPGMSPRLGHEVTGEVITTGAGVTGFAIGALVTGLFHQGFADQAKTTEDRVTPVPPGISFTEAHGEPLACAVSAARRTRVELGDRIAVIGLGFMGLLMTQLIRLKGPAELVGIDPRDDVRATALSLGADRAIEPDAVDDKDRLARPGAGGAGRGFDVVVEASGTQAGLTLAGELAREHGVLSILGYHQGHRDVDMKLWNYKALEVLNAHERRSDYRMDCMRRGLALAVSGRLELSSLTTHTYALDQVDEAFGALETKPPGFIKSVVIANEPA